MKLTKERRQWMRWLSGAGLPAGHVAKLVGLPPAIVTEWLHRPSQRAVPFRFPHKAGRLDPTIKGPAGSKVRGMIELGYRAHEIAKILCLTERTVNDFLKRVTSVRGTLLVRARCCSEQYAVDRTRRLRKKASRVVADRALWNHQDATRDDANQVNAGVPAAAPELACDLAETPAAPGPLPCPELEPNRWNPDNGREWFRGERHGGHKLTWEKVREIRRAHAAGASCYALARQHDVHPGTITAIVKRRTWIESGGAESSPPAPPPVIVATAPAPAGALDEEPRRWKPSPDEPRYGARGSGALHDD